MFLPTDFFDLEDSDYQETLFLPEEPVWTALDRLKGYLGS